MCHIVHLHFPALSVHVEVKRIHRAMSAFAMEALKATYLPNLVVRGPGSPRGSRRGVGDNLGFDLERGGADVCPRLGVRKRADVPERHSGCEGDLGWTLPDVCTRVERGHERIRVDCSGGVSEACSEPQ